MRISKILIILLLSMLFISGCHHKYSKSDFIGVWRSEDLATIKFTEDSCFFINMNWDSLFFYDEFFSPISSVILEDIKNQTVTLNNRSSITSGRWCIEKDVNDYDIIHFTIGESVFSSYICLYWNNVYLRFWVDIDLEVTYDFYKQ